MDDLFALYKGAFASGCVPLPKLNDADVENLKQHFLDIARAITLAPIRPNDTYIQKQLF